MNKEIEDALHTLLHCSLKDTEYETQVEQYKIVRNYITNLEQENEKLKENYERIYNENCILREKHKINDIDLLDENYKLKEVINKANNELITLIQTIMKQPSKNVEEDNYLLNRLEIISNILIRRK